MGKGSRKLLIFGLSILFAIAAYRLIYKPPAPVYYPGDTSRLKTVMEKARRGETITLGFIGGSITDCAGASKKENGYPYLVLVWFKAQFPKATFRLIAAGVGGTGATFALTRVQKDLLSFSPDLVITEFAVNKLHDRKSAESFEKLTKTILDSQQHPANILLFMVALEHGRPINLQNAYIPIGKRFHLPMISYRNYVLPQIESGKLHWSDIMANDVPDSDKVHPNDKGHQIAAKLITNFLDSVRYGAAQ
jgi:lysophospholipase L1-like esterase